MTDLNRELTELLHRHSLENGSETPDFLLSLYLLKCLTTWNEMICARELWYGRPMQRPDPATLPPVSEGELQR